MVHHVELGEQLIEQGRVHRLAETTADDLPVVGLKPVELLEIPAALGFLPVGQQEGVDHHHQGNRHGQIHEPQADGLGFLHRQGGHGEGEGGGEDGMDPGTGGTAVHQGDHNEGEHEDPRQAGQPGVDQVNHHAADGGAHRAGDHPVGALLIAGLEQQEGVEGEPVGVLKFPQEADGGADGHDHCQPQGKAELEPGRGEPLAQAAPGRPPGHLAEEQVVLGVEGLPAQEQQGVEHAAVENAQPSLGQIGLIKKCLDTIGQPLPGGRFPGALQLPHHVGQGVHGVGESRGVFGVLPGGAVGHQVGGPLEEQGQQMIAPLLLVGQLEQVPPVVALPVEGAGQVVEVLPGGFFVPAVSQTVQQVGQPQQAGGDLSRRIGDDVGHLGVDEQGDHQQDAAEAHRHQLGGQLLQRGGPQLQKDEGHGVAHVALGGELTAFPEHQEEGDDEIQNGAQPHVEGGSEGQQTQQQGHQAHGHIVLQPVGLLSAQLKQGGGAGDHHGVGAAKDPGHQQELDHVEQYGGKGPLPPAPEQRREALDAGTHG